MHHDRMIPLVCLCTAARHTMRQMYWWLRVRCGRVNVMVDENCFAALQQFVLVEYLTY